MSVNDPVYVTNVSDKKKTTAIILCLVGFLGAAGIHRIYVGKIFSGLLYFFTFGFFFIGTVIDLIQLLLGQFSDNVGYPLRKS
ncbi:TM2 domain-containing protein [Pectinatus haikarae]|uniref:TM2 domain-containing membrane protein YozV n=1 Tax=Pectinatus haikarae TaxID=349096 RepID=A0ABT9Y3S2_9FIRM|nr:TM2 domain-containing protein [Pectinatus haikarae]MDQ0202474.1 TM2 domain-containing membrane protein YozV [Pectinatus haikarae]